MSFFGLIILALQNLFVEKIREYGDKKSKAGGKLVEASKATEAELQAELDKVNIQGNRIKMTLTL